MPPTPTARPAALANYDVKLVDGTLKVTKAPVSVKADDKTKVYGSVDPELTVTIPARAVESGDSLSGSLEREAGKDVGSYQITKGSLSAGGNYDLTVTPGTLTINKKAITVTADVKTKVVGAVDPALTYKVTSGSLESGDSLSGALTRAAGETIGTYAITQGTLTAGGNYALTFVGSTLKIVYGWDGFLQPINDTAHQTGVQQSKFKLGQTIPAKFVLKNAAVRSFDRRPTQRSRARGTSVRATTPRPPTRQRRSLRTQARRSSGTGASTTTTGAPRTSPPASTGSTRTSPTGRSNTSTSASPSRSGRTQLGWTRLTGR